MTAGVRFLGALEPFAHGGRFLQRDMRPIASRIKALFDGRAVQYYALAVQYCIFCRPLDFQKVPCCHPTSAILLLHLESAGYERDHSAPLLLSKWHETPRARIRAELDATYARLYGLTRKQLRYILDPADLTKKELEDVLDPWEEVDDPLDPEGYAERCKNRTSPAKPSAS